MIAFFLLHDNRHGVLGQPFIAGLGFGHPAHFDGLGVGRGAVHLVHDSEQVGLFFFSQVGQLHRWAQGNLQHIRVFEYRVVYQLQDFRDKVGKADIFAYLLMALARLFRKYLT